jgi:hypothetical protein
MNRMDQASHEVQWLFRAAMSGDVWLLQVAIDSSLPSATCEQYAGASNQAWLAAGCAQKGG